MADLINRKKAVLKMLTELPVTLDAETVQRCIEIVSNMPSAQPEIIYCKDCVHNIITRPNAGNACCELYDGMYDLYGYCHEGERRQDG